MITFFTIPKAFEGHIGIIQTNAIKSWARLEGCNVILFGDECGIDKFEETNIYNHRDIDKNEFNTPMVSDAFNQVRLIAENDFICYINSDILLDHTIIELVKNMKDRDYYNYLLSSRRTDLDVTRYLDFNETNDSINNLLESGTLHGPAGMDLFLFHKSLNLNLPSFSVGRPGWDSWLVYMVRSRGIMFIDCSNILNVIHQNHPAAYKKGGAEAKQNTKAAGGFYKMGTLRDADWVFTNEGRLKRSFKGLFFFNPFVRFILSIRRSLLN